MRNSRLIRVDDDFVQWLRGNFRNVKSDRARTRRLKDKMEYWLIGKKGSVLDPMYILIGFLVLAVAALFILKMSSVSNDTIQSMDIDSEAKSMSERMNNNMQSGVDGMLVTVFFGSAIVSIILAALIPAHWLFIIIYIIEMIFTIIISGMISNAYAMAASLEAFADEAAHLSLTSHIFQIAPIIIVILDLTIAYLIYRGNIYGNN